MWAKMSNKSRSQILLSLLLIVLFTNHQRLPHIIMQAQSTVSKVTNGKIVFVSNQGSSKSEIYTIDADGSHQQRLTNNDSHDWNPAWSNDGLRLVFISDRDGILGRLYLMNSDGTDQTRFLPEIEYVDAPVWSPAGDKIAFQKYNDVRIDIFVVNIDGSGLVNLTEGFSETFNRNPAWSPDGSKIIFAANSALDYAPDTTENRLYIMNADGSNISVFMQSVIGLAHPSISPDDEKVVFYTSSPFNPNLILVNQDVSSTLTLTSDDYVDFDPVWSPTGDKIVYSSLRGRDANQDIMVINADGTGMVNLTDTDQFSEIHPDWQPVFAP